MSYPADLLINVLFPDEPIIDPTARRSPSGIPIAITTMNSLDAIRLVEDEAVAAAWEQRPPALQAFRNRHYTKRDHEATNVIACIAAEAPSDDWEPCDPQILRGLTQLELRCTNSNISYRVFGHL